jgi:spore germination cell wall hydrolase CwlJ-like protein
MVRTVIGEAATEPELGQVAVAWVILTRAKQNVSWYGGNSVADVAQHKAYVIRGKKKRLVWQFEPWMSRSRYLWNIKKESELYKRIQELVKGCISGKYADPTGGATHFLEPAIVRIRRDGKRINGKVVGGSLPTWAQGEGQRIGNHVFFKLDEPAI